MGRARTVLSPRAAGAMRPTVASCLFVLGLDLAQGASLHDSHQASKVLHAMPDASSANLLQSYGG